MGFSLPSASDRPAPRPAGDGRGLAPAARPPRLRRASARLWRFGAAIALALAFAGGWPGLPGVPAARGEPLVLEVVERLRRQHVDAERLNQAELLRAAAAALAEAHGPLLLEPPAPTGDGPLVLTLAVVPPDRSGRLELPPPDGWEGLEAALAVLRRFAQTRLDPPPDADALDTTLIGGLLGAVDRHTEFFTPRAYREFVAGMSGSFAGVGMVVEREDGALRIDEVLSGTPAQRAGLGPGQRIVEIGHEFLEDLTTEQAVERLRGPPGSRVRIGVADGPGAPPRWITLQRESISIDVVQARLFGETAPGGAIGYLRLRSFQPDAFARLREAWDQWPGDTLGGLILDLRGNPGGTLGQAIAVADWFLGEGEIVRTVPARGSGQISGASAERGDLRLPLVVLVDRQSASASEIVAGALRAHGRALLIGERTFGKGSVQNIARLSRGHALKLTIARYLTPGERAIQGVGVMPDLLLRPLSVTPGEVQLRPGAGRKTFPPPRLPPDPPEPPLATLSYLAESPGMRLSAGADPSRDVPLRLALAALRRQAGDTLTMHEAARGAADAEAERQNAALIQALAAQGVDWRALPEPDPGARAGIAEVALRALERPAGELPGPGERVALTVQAAHAGGGPIARLLAVLGGIGQDAPEVEIPLGWLEPGAVRSGRAVFVLPAEARAPAEPFTLTLLAGGGREVARVPVTIPLRPVAPPRIGLVLTLRPAPEAGDGGAELILDATLRHLDGGPSAGGRLLIGAEGEGVELLEPPDPMVGPLGPGQSARALARLRLDDKASGAAIRVQYRNLRWRDVRISHTIPLPAPRLPLTVQLAPPRIELAGGEPPAPAAGALRLAGTVRDDGAAGSLIVRIDGRKAAYLPLEGRGAGWNLNLPLPPGAHRILLEARDDQHLVSRYRFALWNGESPQLPARLAGEPP